MRPECHPTLALCHLSSSRNAPFGQTGSQGRAKPLSDTWSAHPSINITARYKDTTHGSRKKGRKSRAEVEAASQWTIGVVRCECSERDVAAGGFQAAEGGYTWGESEAEEDEGLRRQVSVANGEKDAVTLG